MAQEINYEAEVKKAYPDARIEKAGWGYVYIVSSDKGLSDAFISSSVAWLDAYNNLTKHRATDRLV